MVRVFQATLAILLVGSLCVGPASAAPAGARTADTNITLCDESHFDSAVAAGGSITFNCGAPTIITLHNPAPVTQDPTRIDGGSVITLSGNLHTYLLNVGLGVSLSLSNIALDQGYNQFGDGGAIANGGNLSLNNVTIQNSLSGEFGGAIYSIGRVDILNSRFFDNAAGNGGGLYLSGDDNRSTVTDSRFSGNQGQTLGGGAVYIEHNNTLNVAGGSMSSNLGALGGGAIFIDTGATVNIQSDDNGPAYFYYNHTTDSGGAIYNQGGTLSLVGADLEHNKVPTNTISVGYGGAVADLGKLDVYNSRVAYNEGQFGGGVFAGGSIANATAAITHTVFSANLAGALGGGMYMNTVTTSVTIEDSVFDSNLAPDGGQGGGLARTNAHLTISRSSFTNNSAAYGGGMFLWGAPDPDSGSYVEIHDSTVSNNAATLQNSGGIENKADLDLHSVTIADNHAGLYNENGAIGRLQSSVLDNAPYPDCAGDGTLASTGGHNLATDATCNLSAGEGDLISVPAKLDALLPNPNFFTEFQPPLSGSLLIGNGGPGCAASDQRYALRHGPCDIGAIQLDGLLPRLFLSFVGR